MATETINLSDEELAALFAKAQAGDKAALEEAVLALEPLLRTICYPLCVRAKRTMTTADLLQEARLNAILAIKRYDSSVGVPPGAFVTVCVKRALRFKLDQAERQDGRALSLDAPVRQEDRDLQETVDEVFAYEYEEPDPEITELLRRVPRHVTEGTRLWYLIQAHGLNDKLPDDYTLAELVKAGKTLDELAAMFGVTRRSVQNRIGKIRKSGIFVPSVKRNTKRPKTEMVLNFIRQHPDMKVKDVAKALNVGTTLVITARRLLREGA